MTNINMEGAHELTNEELDLVAGGWTGKSVAVGALKGAVTGTAVGAVAGGGVGAAVGAVIGAAVGAIESFLD
jgi:Bacteriocin class II with double-glycine leader peptide